MIRLVTLSLFGIALLLATVGDASAVLTRACTAPPLLPPVGNVVPVSTEAQLQAAVRSLTSNTTILIQPGTYLLSSTLWVNRDVQDVAIRGGTNSCDDVVLVGRGMSNPSYGDVPHGIWIGNARKILIANLTVRDVYYHPIRLDPGPGAHAPRIYNVRLVDAGEQFIVSSSGSAVPR